MVKHKLNILLTCASTPLSQSIYKALRISRFNINYILADISSLAAGFYLGKPHHVLLPKISDADYFGALKKVISKYRVNVIFPVISAEHRFFNENLNYFQRRKINIITANQSVFELCSDKFESMRKLQRLGINAPDTYLLKLDNLRKTNFPNKVFPLFVKLRRGDSSAHTFLSKTFEQLSTLVKCYPQEEFVAQQYLPASNEYTIGVYISKNKKFTGTFILQRDLKFGLSYRGTVVHNPIIASYALKVCKALNTCYSANVQLKLINGQPYVFEINPRLSSTTSIRAHFGFNEPEMILAELYEEICKYKYSPRYGSFMRYWEEIYLKK